VIKFGVPVPADVAERLPRLVERFAEDPRLDAVWLFGSRARGEHDALSDVDVAVLAKPGATSSELFDWQIEWTGLAATILGTDEVAIQAVNHMPLTVRHGILRDAQLLWERSRAIASDFEMATLARYLDLQPYLDRYDRDLFRQAASGTLR
jgi:predicted nucleotidyltransferase